MLVLQVLQGPDKGRRFEMPDSEPQLIGRSSEALPLADQTISRRHAELTPDDGRWYIRDIRSSNGTFVNGVKVHDRRLLEPGDQIRTGNTLFLFGQDATVKRRHGVRVAREGEMTSHIEQTAASNDDSMIMAVPEPSQAASLQLRVIYDLTQIIGSADDRQQLLERIMDLVFEYLQPDRGFILLQEHPTDRPDPVVVRRSETLAGVGAQEHAGSSAAAAGTATDTRAGAEAGLADTAATAPGKRSARAETDRGRKGRERDASERRTITVSRTIVQHVLQKSEGVLSSNAMSDERFAKGDSVRDMGIRSAICVPIKFKERIYGVIHIDSLVANYTFTEDQLRMLTAVGVQTGMALANFELYTLRLQRERLAAVGETVASLSHSVKNIIQGLRGGADVVELGLKKADLNLVNKGWPIVTRNLDRIHALTMNMLAFSTRRKPELEMTNLPPLIEEVAQLLQKQCEDKQVALITDVDSDLPPVPVDPGGIHQCLLNLIMNALEAVPSETGAVTLTAGFDPEQNLVRIRVIDNGHGMDENTRESLFEPFHSTKGMRGTGLGLVVTKKIIDEHGGKIEVESTPGEGTTFTLSLSTQLAQIPQSAETHSSAGRAAPERE